MTNEKMSDEQKDFLIDCLEEGLTPKQIMEFADPNFSVNVMRRLQEKGSCHDGSVSHAASEKFHSG